MYCKQWAQALSTHLDKVVLNMAAKKVEKFEKSLLKVTSLERGYQEGLKIVMVAFQREMGTSRSYNSG